MKKNNKSLTKKVGIFQKNPGFSFEVDLSKRSVFGSLSRGHTEAYKWPDKSLFAVPVHLCRSIDRSTLLRARFYALQPPFLATATPW